MSLDNKIDTLKRCCYDIAVEKNSTDPSRYKWDVTTRIEAMKTYAMLVEAENGKRSNKAQ